MNHGIDGTHGNKAESDASTSVYSVCSVVCYFFEEDTKGLA